MGIRMKTRGSTGLCVRGTPLQRVAHFLDSVDQSWLVADRLTRGALKCNGAQTRDRVRAGGYVLKKDRDEASLMIYGLPSA